MTTQTMISQETITALIASYFKAIREMDLEAWVATFAEDAMLFDPVTIPPYCGHEAIRQFFLAIAQMLESITMTEEFVHITGNEVAVKFQTKAVGKSGQEAVCGGIDMFEINSAGKIQTVRGYWDQVAFLTQLQS